MDNYRVLILEYLLFKGDFYHNEYKTAIHRLRTEKHLNSFDLERIYKAVLMDELFDSIQRDICRLLDILP